MINVLYIPIAETDEGTITDNWFTAYSIKALFQYLWNLGNEGSYFNKFYVYTIFSEEEVERMNLIWEREKTIGNKKIVYSLYYDGKQYIIHYWLDQYNHFAMYAFQKNKYPVLLLSVLDIYIKLGSKTSPERRPNAGAFCFYSIFLSSISRAFFFILIFFFFYFTGMGSKNRTECTPPSPLHAHNFPQNFEGLFFKLVLKFIFKRRRQGIFLSVKYIINYLFLIGGQVIR